MYGAYVVYGSTCKDTLINTLLSGITIIDNVAISKCGKYRWHVTYNDRAKVLLDHLLRHGKLLHTRKYVLRDILKVIMSGTLNVTVSYINDNIDNVIHNGLTYSDVLMALDKQLIIIDKYFYVKHLPNTYNAIISDVHHIHELEYIMDNTSFTYLIRVIDVPLVNQLDDVNEDILFRLI